MGMILDMFDETVSQIPREKLIELMDDEQKAVKEYNELGLHNLADDEQKHYDFLKKKLKGVV